MHTRPHVRQYEPPRRRARAPLLRRSAQGRSVTDRVDGRDPAPEGVSSSPYLIHLPRGVAGAEPYRVIPTPPTPRQIRELMTRIGVEPALELLMRHHEKSPQAPVLSGDLGFAMVDEFLELGRTRDAIAVNRVYVKLDPENSGSYRKIGLSYEKYGRRSGAIDYFKKALILDPADAEAAEHLKKLQSPGPFAAR